MSVVDPIILKAFLNESSESVSQLESDLLQLEGDLSNIDLINSVFRALHTIKGNSSFLDLNAITEMTHEAESILDRVRKGQDTLTQEIIDIIYLVVDILHAMIQNPDALPDTSAVKQRLLAYSKNGASHTVTIANPAAEKKDLKPANPTPNEKGAVMASTIRIEESKIEKMVNMVNELKIVRYAIEMMPGMLEKIGDEAKEVRFSLDIAISKMTRLTGDLGALVYGARLVPVGNVFRKFPRVVRDLSQRLGKEIELVIKNEDAELDKGIVEAIADPMTHLIRNSADHGIELPEDRIKAGKNKIGKVTLNSFVDVNSVVIEIADDGKGINTEIVARKAVEKGVIPAEKAHTMNYNEKLGLIFAPGFSTAEKVTDISGRGVGMDVVKSNINKLKGTVLIDSKVGEGTTIQLRFPLSIMVLRCLYVYSAGVCYAIPLQQITESVTLTKEQLFASRPMGRDKHEILQIYSLEDLLWDKHTPLGKMKSLYAMKVKNKDGQIYGLMVDQFSYMEEAIVHSVDSYISSIPGIQGGVIRRDGSVTVALNLDSLHELIKIRRPAAFARIPETEVKGISETFDLPTSLNDLVEKAGEKAG